MDTAVPFVDNVILPAPLLPYYFCGLISRESYLGPQGDLATPVSTVPYESTTSVPITAPGRQFLTPDPTSSFILFVHIPSLWQ